MHPNQYPGANVINNNPLYQSAHTQLGENYNVQIQNEQTYNTVNNENIQFTVDQSQFGSHNNERIGDNNTVNNNHQKELNSKNSLHKTR